MFWLAGLCPLIGAGQQTDIVQYAVTSADAVNIGDTFRVTVTIGVKNGWHVYAPVDINRQQQLHLTDVRFGPLPSGVHSVGPVVVPPAGQKGFHAVYEGEHHAFSQQFIVDSAGSAESILLQGKIRYQACNATTCFPPVTEKFEKSIHIYRDSHATLPGDSESLFTADSAWAIVQQATKMFATEADYNNYLQLVPLAMKLLEDQAYQKQIKTAIWFLKIYPHDIRVPAALDIFFTAHPHFIDRTSCAYLDSIVTHKGFDWIAFMRSLAIDTAARHAWLLAGDSLVREGLRRDTATVSRERLEFRLFARDFRIALVESRLLPRKAGEERYWAVLDEQYWEAFFARFQAHATHFGDLPVIADRAQDFLSALSSRAPQLAAGYWSRYLHWVNTDSLSWKKAGLQALGATALQQLDALQTEKGEKPLAISFIGLDNRVFDLAQLKGKVVIIDFWASWCGPCVAELPILKTLYDKYHQHGLEIAGICLDEQGLLPKVSTILQKNKVQWPQRFEGKGFQDDSLRLLFGIHSLPTVWVVDQSGKIISTTARGETLDALIANLLSTGQK